MSRILMTRDSAKVYATDREKVKQKLYTKLLVTNILSIFARITFWGKQSTNKWTKTAQKAYRIEVSVFLHEQVPCSKWTTGA